MAGIYSVSVETSLSSAHVLRGYEGPCSKLHGHNWKIIAEVSSTKLNDMGMVVDFKIVKNQINTIAEILDHKYINEIPPFDTINPTAENIAAWFYKQLSKKINDENIKLTSITIFETEKSFARYSEK